MVILKVCSVLLTKITKDCELLRACTMLYLYFLVAAVGILTTSHMCVHVCKSLQLHPTSCDSGLQPARPLCPWDSPGQSAGVGCHAPLQGTFPTRDHTRVSYSCISWWVSPPLTPNCCWRPNHPPAPTPPRTWSVLSITGIILSKRPQLFVWYKHIMVHSLFVRLKYPFSVPPEDFNAIHRKRKVCMFGTELIHTN